MFTFEYFVAEVHVVNPEPTTESSPLSSPENTLPQSPRASKLDDEDASKLSPIVIETTLTNLERSVNPPKTEKGSSEEGFCCVMSMHDGVVL